MDQRYHINHSAVASEVVNGEAIMMHHPSGDYFSTEGVGAVIWRWIGEARSHDQMLRALQTSFPGSGGIATALEAFLTDLSKHDLIRQALLGDDEAPGVPLPQATELAGEFAPPTLNVYTDMRDVLLLDPIHEVNEISGWPVQKGPSAKP